MVERILERLQQIEGVTVRADELLSLHTTLRVGGPCDLMVWVSTDAALLDVLEIAMSHNLPVTVLGNGSNVLVRDGGIPGIVLRLIGDLSSIEVDEEYLRAGGGAPLSELVSTATQSGIGGLEFLGGIPGTAGGALLTNAGSRDEWLSSRLVEFEVVEPSGRKRSVRRDEVNFGYRQSKIPEQWIVTSVLLKGYRSDIESIRRRVEADLARRRQTQPLGDLTAGCIFKNPLNASAGELIEKAGLKGHKLGAAQISTTHANFIVNTGGATAREILDLVELTRARVKSVHGVDLELEINVIGRG